MATTTAPSGTTAPPIASGGILVSPGPNYGGGTAYSGSPAAPAPIPPGTPPLPTMTMGQNIAPGTYALPGGLGVITIAQNGTSQVTPAPGLTPAQQSQLSTYDYVTFNNGSGSPIYGQNRPTGLNPATDAPYTYQDFQTALTNHQPFSGLVEMPNGTIEMMGSGYDANGQPITTNGTPGGAAPGGGAPGTGGTGTGPGGTALPPGTTVTPEANGTTLTTDAQGNQSLSSTVGGVTTTLNFSTASQIINSALQVVGLDPNAIAASGVNQGQTLAQYFWGQIVGQGITDQGTVGEMISTLLPSTGQFEASFPGYQDALKAGYVRTPAEYIQAEEGITAVMLQGGVPHDLINPTTVGKLISNGVSVNEVAQRVNNGLDAALNAPAEVQNYFAQEFGQGNSTKALATVFLNPEIDAVTLQKMLAGAQIRGAFAASNLTVSQGLSQRLADEGQTYASAQQAAKNLNQQRGLFEQTVGEQSSQAPVPGTFNENRPLNINDQGVQAAIGTNAADEQQVHQVALERQNEFRGTGGASTTQSAGFSGLAEAKQF